MFEEFTQRLGGHAAPYYVGDGVEVPSIVHGEGIRSIDWAGVDDEHLREFFAVKATDVQLVNPLITALVIGQMQLFEPWVEFVAPPIGVSSVTFDRPTWLGNEQMERKDTKRAESVEYEKSDVTPSKATGKVERHSWATMVDQRTLNNATPGLRVAEKFAAMAARIVLLSKWFELRDVMQTTTTAVYATGHVTAISSGSEWNDATPGDPRAQALPLIELICNKTGCQPHNLRMMLPVSSRIALQQNDTFQAWLKGDLSSVRLDVGRNEGGAAAIADFFGVGDCMLPNPWGKAGGTTGPIFADNAFFWLPGAPAEVDDSFGETRWIAYFRMNAGISTEPFYLPLKTSWVYPWDEEWTDFADAVINTGAAALLTNTSATV